LGRFVAEAAGAEFGVAVDAGVARGEELVCQVAVGGGGGVALFYGEAAV
jgi:hypothetical protein